MVVIFCIRYFVVENHYCFFIMLIDDIGIKIESDMVRMTSILLRDVAKEVSNELIVAHWKIGEIIVRDEQNDSICAAYEEQTLKQLSKALAMEFKIKFANHLSKL